MRRSAILVGLFLLMACHNGNSEAKDKGAAKDNRGKYYEVGITPHEVAVDQKSQVVVTFTPGSGYKWNDEYPAKFKLVAPEALELTKTEFSMTKKEIDISKEAARLTIPLVAHAAGRQELKLTGSFSVCNDTSCKIMRDEAVTVAIEGK